MKRFIIGVAALVVADCIVPACAADLNYGQPAPYAPYAYSQPYGLYNWGGPYVGANLGYGWGEVGGSLTNPSGFIAGVQAGYNFQNGPWVFGLEGDIQASGADNTVSPWKYTNPWFGTIRGRGGYAFNNILLYGTAGLAFGELRAETIGQSETHTNAGWTVGVGGEVGLTQNWSAKIEYLHVDLSSSRFAITGGANDFSSNVVRVGVNYHFW